MRKREKDVSSFLASQALSCVEKGIALDVVNALCKETGGQGAIECSFVSHVGVDTVFETALSFLTEPHIVPPLALVQMCLLFGF